MGRIADDCVCEGVVPSKCAAKVAQWVCYGGWSRGLQNMITILEYLLNDSSGEAGTVETSVYGSRETIGSDKWSEEDGRSHCDENYRARE